ncbi:MAG TPA: hypothetical protein VIQ53_14820, partial [Inquilinus sp.]
LLRAELAPFLLSWSEVVQSWTAAAPAVPTEPPATPATASENASPESVAACSAALRDSIHKSSGVLDTLGARLQLL